MINECTADAAEKFLSPGKEVNAKLIVITWDDSDEELKDFNGTDEVEKDREIEKEGAIEKLVEEKN